VAPAQTPEEAPAAPQPSTEQGGSELINRVAGAIGSSIGKVSPVPLPGSVIAALAAAELGFLRQAYQRLVAEGAAWRIAVRLLPLAVPPASWKAAESFVLGFLEGLVSPITGLYHLIVGLGEAAAGAVEWLAALPERYPAIVREGKLLAEALRSVWTKATASVAQLRDPKGLQSFALALFEGAEALQARIIGAAQSAGRRAADSAVSELQTGDLNQLTQTVGLVTGTAIIEIVLLVFTDGIGNLVTKIGELASILRPLSRGAEVFAAVARNIGGWITGIEELIGLLMSRTVLRPLRPLLEEIEPLIQRVRSFGRALLEGEEAAARAATSMATRAGARGETHAAEATAGRAPSPASTPPGPAPRSLEGAAPPPPSSAAGGGGGPGRPSAGATAEGHGAAFRYEYHPETPSPDVSYGPRSGVIPEASAAPAPPLLVEPDQPAPFPDIGEAVEEASEGTASVETSPHDPDLLREKTGESPRRLGGVDVDARSAREVLGQNMRSRYGPKLKGYQDHHIVPWELRNHPAVYEYERQIAGVENPTRDVRGRWINSAENGLSLPSEPGLSGAEDLAVHSGSHPVYTDWVRSDLDDLWYRYTTRGSPMTIGQFGREFESLVGKFEGRLRSSIPRAR
jgi:hypothetical protein